MIMHVHFSYGNIKKNKKEDVAMNKKLGKLVANTAKTVTAANVNTACIYIFNQPEMPKNAKKLRKF